MNTWTITLGIYLISVIAWIFFLLSPKIKARRSNDNKFEKTFTYITIPFAPICWIVGLIVLTRSKKDTDRPRPLPKSLQGKLKKDRVIFNGKAMSIAEVNRITGKDYTLEDVYGKKYVAALSEEDLAEFDHGESKLEISDHVRKDEDFDIVYDFTKAQMSGDLESIRHLFEPDIIVVDYEKETINGIDAAIVFWKDLYTSSIERKVKFDFRIGMCMFYNGPGLTITPEGYAPMAVLFRIRNGKISQMVLSPAVLSSKYPYFGGFREAPFTEEYFKKFLRDKNEPIGNRIPCPNCGELSEGLDWYNFHFREPYEDRIYEGTVSMCPHCHRTVEILPISRFDNELYNSAAISNYKKQNEPNFLPTPKLYTHGFDYSMPLAGSDYIQNLDDTELIELENAKMLNFQGVEFEPCTARTCASVFNSLMISKLSRNNPPLFDDICGCYKRAYEDGVVEAGNNLAILYFNYARKADEGIYLFKECVEKGCANAANNLFACLWGSEETKEEAIRFAINSKTPSIPLYWNLAVLYLSGPDIKGNTLDADFEKAKSYLTQIIGGRIPSSGGDDRFIKQSRDLLRKIDDFDLLISTAKEYIKDGIPTIVRTAERDDSQEYDLYRVLRHIRIPEGTTLKLHLPTDENGRGDISRFQLFNKGGESHEPICQEEDIIYKMSVDKNIYGAWNVYLFSKARNLLPVFWHGGYNIETLLFGTEDLNVLISQRGRCRDVIVNGDDLKPKVYFDGDTAIVESCYWSEWGGLFRETVKIVFEGDHVIDFKYEGRENLYMYDCGIMF